MGYKIKDIKSNLYIGNRTVFCAIRFTIKRSLIDQQYEKVLERLEYITQKFINKRINNKKPIIFRNTVEAEEFISIILPYMYNARYRYDDFLIVSE